METLKQLYHEFEFFPVCGLEALTELGIILTSTGSVLTSPCDKYIFLTIVFRSDFSGRLICNVCFEADTKFS